MVIVPTKMGQLNRRALLTCLQQVGAASRADLAKSLELSQPTVGKIADELINLGIVEELSEFVKAPARSRVRSKAGRPGRVLSLNRSTPRFLGIHLDVNETRFSLMPIHPRPVDQWDLVLPTAKTPRGWARVVSQSRSYLDSNDLIGIVLSVPGVVDEAAGRVLFSPNVHWTEKVFLPAALHERSSLPVVIIQELRALALGHRMLKATDEDFLAVDLGEGVGSAAIVEGRLYASQFPVSGELGHTPVQGNRRRCGCGATGCLETIISRCGLLQSWREASADGESTLAGLGTHIEQQGLPGWLGETLDRAGEVIAGALNMMGLRTVIVSGVLNDLPESVQQRLEESVSNASLWQRFGKISCLYAPRHHTAGMVAVGLDRLVIPSNSGASMTHRPVGRRAG